MSCLKAGKGVGIERLFFYLSAIFVLAVCLALLLGACDDGEIGLQSGDASASVELVIGDGDVVRSDLDSLVLSEPERDGYLFEGWYLDEGFAYKATVENVAELAADKLPDDGIIRVYAKWRKILRFSDVLMRDSFYYYDELSHSPTVEGLPDGASVEYSGEYVDAGEYDVEATVSAEGYYDLTLSAKLTIAKAKIDVSKLRFDSAAYVWDGEEKSLAVEGELPSAVSVSYIGNAQSEVGEYNVTARFDVGENYLPIEDMTATLTISERLCTVTFVEESGETTVRTVGYGKSLIDVPAPAQKRGYIGGWSDGSFENIRENMTVRAVYEVIPYDISYHTNGGDCAETAGQYTVLDGVSLPSASRDYFVFGGWFDNEDLIGSVISEIPVGSVGDREYFAKWIPLEYRVSFDCGGGINQMTNTTDGTNYIYTALSAPLELAPATRHGYAFVCWRDEDGNTVEVIESVSPSDYTLYAEWIAEVYDIEYVLNGGVNGAEFVSCYTVEDGEIVLPLPTRAGYDFCGWHMVETLDDDKISSVVSSIAADIVLFAEWRIKDYTITYELNGGANNFANPSVYNVENGALTLYCAFRIGYSFVGWFKDAEFMTDEVTELDALSDGDVTLYACWQVDEYGVTYVLNGGTNAADNPSVYTVEDEDIILCAPSRRGYDFEGWFTTADFDGEAVNKINCAACENLKFYAKWKAIRYGVTYELNGGVNATGNPSAYTVEEGNIILRAPSKHGYDFDGWYASADFDGESVGFIDIAACEDIVLYAKWTAIDYRITYNLGGGINSAYNPLVYTIEDGEILIAEPVKDGSIFKGWFASARFDGEPVLKIECADCTDIELFAKWEEIENSGGDDNVDENVDENEFTVETVDGKNVITAYLGEDADIVIPVEINGVKIDDVATGVLMCAKSVRIDAELSEINREVFSGCERLENIVLPCTLECLPHGIFADCVSLKSLTLPFAGDQRVSDKDGVYYPLGMLFGDEEKPECYAVSVRPTTVTGGTTDNAFDDPPTRYVPSSLKEVTVLDGDILSYSFYGFSSLTAIEMFGGGTTVGQCAFRGCTSLTAIRLSEGVTTLERSALLQCNSLANIYVGDGADIASIEQAIADAKLQGTVAVKKYGE